MKVRWGVVAVVGLSLVGWGSTVALSRDTNAIAGKGAAVAALMRDPLSLLAMRSPGERGAGALLSTKPARAPGPPNEPEPRERVKPTIRERPVPGPLAGGVPDDFGGPAFIPVEGFPPQDLLPVPFGPDTGTPDDGWLYPPGGPWFPVGPGSGGGGGGGWIPTPPTTPSPVPEPATWAMMILGFFLAGYAIRRGGVQPSV